MRISLSRLIENDTGATLVEVLVALAIGAIAIVIVSMSLPGLAAYARRDTAEARVERILEEARYIAQKTQNAVRVEFGHEEVITVPPVASALDLRGNDVELNVISAAELGERGKGVIVFLPSGFSSGGEIRFTRAGRVRVLEISWATGVGRWHE